jgi:ceramide glucosyltransferase
MIPGGVLMLLGGAGTLYMLAVAVVLRRYFARPMAAPVRSDAVTLLKPLHGAEPRLVENLATFLEQRHVGPVQMLCGVMRSDDAAIPAFDVLRAAHPDADIMLVRDPTSHGASGKISNLTNMDRHASHDIVILSDSDIAVAPDYLGRVLAALDERGVGAVSCLYCGRGDAGFWSDVAAAGVNWQFMPVVVFSLSFGLARPCMGSTIAMRRETLDAIGGFARFADVLADDHAIGAAVESLGLKVAVPPMFVTHGSDETSLTALWRREIRWGVTVRGLVPSVVYAASMIRFPLPLALLAVPFAPLPALSIATCALAARLVVATTTDRIAAARPAPYWLLPFRDCLSFAVFVASFFTRSVDWRGVRLTMGRDDRVMAAMEIMD